MGWIGVDLDGTLAYYEPYKGSGIGDPIPSMVEKIMEWIGQGIEVRILTARACEPAQIPIVEAWLRKHNLPQLRVTNQKDYGMLCLWDDKAVQVIRNTGERVGDVEIPNP